MTPQDELRAAASIVRERAAKATPGPWLEGGYGNYGPTVHDVASTFGIETEDSDRGKGNAAWIALANPLLAEPLADWLEETAEGFEIEAYALTIARVIFVASRVGANTGEGEPKLLDPDCRDGKCGSCVGGPCEHSCHGEGEA